MKKSIILNAIVCTFARTVICTLMCTFMCACGLESNPTSDDIGAEEVATVSISPICTEEPVKDFYEGLTSYASIPMMHEACRLVCKELLTKDGRINKGDELYSLTLTDISDGESQDVTLDEESEYTSDYTFFSLDDAGVPSLYKDTINWQFHDDRIYVLNEQMTDSELNQGTTEKDFFLAAETQDGKAELYGLVGRGYILKVGESVYPVKFFADNDAPSYFVAADVDKDGADEYGFTVCDGRGSGCYTECLYIVDPGEEGKVSYFNVENIKRNNSNIFDRISSDFDADTGILSCWLEENGDRKDYQEIVVKDEMSDEYTCTGLGFGDLFYISFQEGEWCFEAVGGSTWTGIALPLYEYSVSLYGRLKYTDDVFECVNLKLAERSK